MAQPIYGSVARPVSLDPFQRIVEVGWAGGGLVTIEAEFLQGVSGFIINILNPEGNNVGTMQGLSTVTPADYRDEEMNWLINRVGEPHVIQADIVTQDEINDIWFWDGFYIGALPSSISDPVLSQRQREINEEAVEDGNRMFGPFKLHFEGMQVAYDVQTYKRPVLGDIVLYTHPNGHQVNYSHGATPLGIAYSAWKRPIDIGGEEFFGLVIRTSDPGGFPNPPADLSNTESWYWYQLRSSPGATVDKVRQSYLAYFKSGHLVSAEIRNEPQVMPDTIKVTLKGYPDGTTFTISEGKINPDPTQAPKWQYSESFPSSMAMNKRFAAGGMIS